MANDYTTLAAVKATFLESTDYNGTTDYDSVFSALITVASRLIDRTVGRWDGFFAGDTDVTMYFDGSGTPVQNIPEFAAITSVALSDDGTVDSTSYAAVASTNYFTQYFDDANRTAHGRPINRLVIDTLNGTETCFWRYPRSVKVIGVPGWSTTVPGEVAEAAKIQVVRWFMRTKQNFMDVSSNGVASPMAFTGKARLDPDVKALLWPFIMELTAL